MKAGVVGAGGVGTACVFAMAMRGSARAIVLANRDRERAEGTIADLRYGALLAPPVALEAGGYEALAGCRIVAITAGVNEKGGGATDRSDPKGRLRLLAKNAAVYREIVPAVVRAAPDALLLVVTDPPDPLADVARALAPRSRVLGTGTFLDSLRLRFHIAQRLGVDARSVDAMVLGEHGTSAVFAWSCARVGGEAVRADARLREEVEKDVKFANIDIIEGTGASRLGIGVAVARIVEMVLRDEKAVIPLASFHERYGTTLSLPSVVGAGGVERVLEPALSDEEARALERGAQALRAARDSLGEGRAPG
jgi:L-lactate dehydrogenase